MIAFSQIYEDAPEFIEITKALQHQRVEVILLPLNELSEISKRKRTSPAHFAGRVKELGDVMSSVSALAVF